MSCWSANFFFLRLTHGIGVSLGYAHQPLLLALARRLSRDLSDEVTWLPPIGCWRVTCCSALVSGWSEGSPLRRGRQPGKCLHGRRVDVSCGGMEKVSFSFQLGRKCFCPQAHRGYLRWKKAKIRFSHKTLSYVSVPKFRAISRVFVVINLWFKVLDHGLVWKFQETPVIMCHEPL